MMSIPSKMVIIITQFQQDFRWNLELILNLHGRRKVHQQLKKFLKRRVKRINSHYLILRHTVLSCTLPDIKTYYTELSFLCFIAGSQCRLPLLIRWPYWPGSKTTHKALSPVATSGLWKTVMPFEV